MELKNLRVGVILYPSQKGIVFCLDGSLRFASCEQYKENDIVFFRDDKSDSIDFLISICEFDYFKDYSFRERHECDELLYKQGNGLCVPKKYLNQSTKFIVDSGDSRQFIIYLKNQGEIYADWRYIQSERDIIRNYFCTYKPIDPKRVLLEVDSYLNNFDINSVLESFTIINEEKFISRPGRDDYYFIDKVSKRFEDEYIDSLFPHIDESIYSHSGYCSAYSMRINIEKRAYKDEEFLAIENAKAKYDVGQHRIALLNKEIQELLDKQKDYYENLISIKMSFFEEIKKLLQNDIINIDYAKHLNELIREYYRIANNNSESEWHNYYNKITR